MPDPRPFPRPDTTHPIRLPDGSRHPGSVYLNAIIDHPRIDVGDYSYASAHHPPADWAAHLAPFTYPFSPERLVIGRFCQIGDGAIFVTASANHRHDGISTYPFAIFGGPPEDRPSMPGPGRDTVLGHDIWIGTRAVILPGARIGSGLHSSGRAPVVVEHRPRPTAWLAGNAGNRVDPAALRRGTSARAELLGAWPWIGTWPTRTRNHWRARRRSAGCISRRTGAATH